MFKKLFLIKKLKGHIKHANEILYAEKYDYSMDQDLSFNNLIGDIIKNERNDANLLLAYIAVSLSAKSKFPINKHDINQSIDDYNNGLLQLDYQDPQINVLETWKLKALINILKFSADKTIGHLAYKNNKYSYDGLIYHMSKINKGPLTSEKQLELVKLTTELSEKERLIKEIENS